MLGPETGRNQRRRDEPNRGADEIGPRLRKSLPFVAAFVAGFLLGRQDGGGAPDEWTEGEGTKGEAAEGEGTEGEWTEDEWNEGEGIGVLDAVARVRQRMMSGGTEDAVSGGVDDAGSDWTRTAGSEAADADESSGIDAASSADASSGVGAASEIEEEPGIDATAGADGGAEADGMTGTDEMTGADEPTGTDETPGASDATSPDEVTSADETPEIDEAVVDLSAPTTREMPMVGVGTAEDWDYDECFESIREAFRIGYRHVDATERREAYHNEAPVGDAIAESEVPREEVFVATKVSPADLAYEHVLTSAEESLDRLGLDYVDLLYVHWPTGEYEPAETLEAFAELRQEGMTEEIGVSNFTVDLLEEAIEISEEPIFANQVEMHPLLPQEDLREFCARDDVDVELVAYSPIARGDVEDVEELQSVAAKHEITPEQVSLAWLREKGVTAIPEATTEDHLRENWLSLGVDLDDEDIEKLDSIEERRRIVDPDEAPWNT